MLNNLSFLILAIAVISKSKQTTSKIQQHQFDDLFTFSNEPKVSVEVEAQQVQEKFVPKQQTFQPITFPSSDEDRDVVIERFPLPSSLSSPSPPQGHSANLIVQNVDQKFPSTELARPTRVAVPVAAATSSSDILSSRFTDDQLDYVRDFGWNMFKGSKLPSSIGNLILSPIQPQLQLSLLRTAAAGLTEEEIAQAIREVNPSITKELVGNLRTSNSVSTNLGVASAVFARNTLKLNNSFINAAHEREVDIVPVNFESADETKYVINNWVANATDNRIKELIKDSFSSDTQVILTNSLYFNGEWKYGFNEVKIEPFYTTERLSKNVQMMKNLVSLRSGAVNLRNGFQGQWVELPYRGDEFSMVLIIPTQRHYLDEFIRSMQAHEFAEIMKQLTSPYKKLVHLSMPKFTVSSSFSVVNVLLKMGVVDLFTQTSRLPYLTNDGQPLRVQDIIQNGYLSVDEKGTIAAVATISHVVTLSLNSAPEEVFFKVDQPFLSIIVDKRNKVPVFISKMFDP